MNFENSKENIIFKLKELSTKKKLKLFGKISICFFSLIGLVIQTWLLSIQFNEKKTTVNTELKTERYTHLPAVTVCYPIFTSLHLLSNRYPQLEEEYEKYENTVAKLLSESENQYNINTNESIDAYFNSIAKLREEYEYLLSRRMGVFNMFDYSLPYRFIVKNGENSFTENSIYALVPGLHYNTSDGNKLSTETIMDETPIESISFPYVDGSPHKCFTFFSIFREKWKSFKMIFKEIYLFIRHDHRWNAPIYKKNNMILYFAMHSPNSIPPFNRLNYLQLEVGFAYSIAYSRIKSKLLEPPYATNCYDYRNNKMTEAQSRSECIEICVNKMLRKCVPCLHRSGTVFRKETIAKNEMMCTFRTSYDCLNAKNKEYNHVLLNDLCENECKNDCDQEFYDFEIRNKEANHYYSWSSLIDIKVMHRNSPDMMIEHLPKMTLIDFMSSFGGLMGIWLGLSVIAFYDFIINVFKYLIIKPKSKFSRDKNRMNSKQQSIKPESKTIEETKPKIPEKPKPKLNGDQNLPKPKINATKEEENLLQK